MKYYIVSGEASGDLHGSNLMKEIKEKDNEAKFRFFGGDLMKKQGGDLVVHYKELSFMGFWEVLKNLKTILKFMKLCKKDIREYSPDVLILIDYPGFNLKIAKYAKSILSIKKLYYYISPQLWAWKSGRIEIIKKYVDKLFVILPFEKKWYNDRGYDNVFYVGHPLLDVLNDRKKVSELDFIRENNLEEKPIIGILPGSRKQEISKMLPTMLKVIEEFKEYQFVVAKSRSIDMDFYRQFMKDYNAKIVDDKTYDLLEISKGALVASGTATLETALIGTPQVVCYRGGVISYYIAKMLIKTIKYISLVNLIMNKEVVKELIQDDFNKKNLVEELKNIISDGGKKQIQEYRDLKNMLKYGSSNNVANIIWQDIS